MGLFDRNNPDRDRGAWGGSPEYGGGNRGGGFMGGVRRGWDRVEHGVRDAFDRDDDRGYSAGRYGADYNPGYGGYNREGGMAGRDFGGHGGMGGWTAGGG